MTSAGIGYIALLGRILFSDTMSTELQNRFARRPGKGWRWLGSSVWEHTPSGLRIHGLGYCRPPGQQSRPWPWQVELAVMRQQGWNKKRALMVWGLSLLPNDTVSQTNREDRAPQPEM